MFVQMIVIFFVISFADLVILAHDGMERVHQFIIFSERVVPEIPVEEDLRLQPLRHRAVYIKPGNAAFLLPVFSVEVFQRVGDRAEDMLLSGRLGQGVSGNRVLKASELGVRVMSEGSCRPLCQKQMSAVQQFPPGRGDDQVLVLIQTQDLDHIGIAVQEEVDSFPERKDHSVRGPVFKLLKRGQPDQVRRHVHGHPAKVNITSLPVCPVTMASADTQEHDPASQTGVVAQERVFRPARQAL